MAKKKDKINVVYSTNPDFQYAFNQNEEQATLPPQQQDLRVAIDRKQRAGKEVTLVTGFIGTTGDLEALGKSLKQKCGVGGAVKDGQIMIQGDQLQKVMDFLIAQKFKVKKIGGK
jgi:translation initiation factor 1